MMIGQVFHPIPVRVESQTHHTQDKDLPQVHPGAPVAFLPARTLASSNAKISA